MSVMRAWVRWTAAAAVLALVVAACGGEDADPGEDSVESGETDDEGAAGDDEGGEEAAAEEPAAGGSLTITLWASALTLDPAADATMSPTGDAQRMAAVYDFLFLADPVTGEAVPHIGESLEPSEDGQVWTLTVRDGVEFTDGTPYDAEAVKATWERHAELEVSPEASTVAGWEMEVLDPLTLEIRVPESTMHLDKLVARSLPFIASPTAIAEDPDGFGQNPVGAGPYMLEEWVEDSHETYVANPDYWQGEPHLDDVRMVTIADGNQRVNSIGTGEADLQSPTAAADLTLFEQASDQGLVVEQSELNGGGWIYFNNDRPPFDDQRAREAIYRAIDRDQLAQVAQGSPDAQAVQTLFVEDSPFYASDLTFPSTDRDRAQELFDELAADGNPVEFTFVNISGNEANTRAAEFLQTQLRELDNVEMEIDSIDLAAARERVFMNRDYDMSPYPSAYTFADPEPNLYDLLHSDGGFNTTSFSDPDVDAALEAARASSDEAERAELYREVQEAVVTEVPGLFTYTPAISTIARDDVAGLEYVGQGLILWDRLGLSG